MAGGEPSAATGIQQNRYSTPAMCGRRQDHWPPTCVKNGHRSGLCAWMPSPTERSRPDADVYRPVTPTRPAAAMFTMEFTELKRHNAQRKVLGCAVDSALQSVASRCHAPGDWKTEPEGPNRSCERCPFVTLEADLLLADKSHAEVCGLSQRRRRETGHRDWKSRMSPFAIPLGRCPQATMNIAFGKK